MNIVFFSFLFSLWFIQAPAASVSQTYDALNRLLQIAHGDGTATAYTYDAAGNRLSQTVTLAIPTITTNPQTATVVAGDTAAFTVGASGSAPLTYSWMFNAADISGENNWRMYLANVSPGKAGNYTVIVSNSAGSVTSSPATLTVLIPFNYWATVYFAPEELDQAGISGPLAEPWSDGVPNLLKFLANIDPATEMSAADRAALPQVGSEVIGPTQYLTLTYRMNSLATGIVVEVQASPDLSPNSWQTILPEITEQLPADPITGDPIYRVKVNVTGEPKKFIRLKVNQPEF